MTPRAIVSEALGTALLVATVIGSAIMAQALTQDVGVLLLANALVTGAMLFVLITILGPLSGAHFNPLVTLIMAARRDLAWGAVLPYLMAQIVGALAGLVLTHAMFDLSLVQVSTHVRGGQGQVLAEAVATFGLIFTIFGGIQPDHAARAVHDQHPIGHHPLGHPVILGGRGGGRCSRGGSGRLVVSQRRLRQKKNPRPCGRGSIGWAPFHNGCPSVRFVGLCSRPARFKQKLKRRLHAEASCAQVSLRGGRLRLARALF